MIKRFKAFFNGVWHYADITRSQVVDGVHMRVYTRNYKNEEADVFNKDYRTVRAAERSLTEKHFPDGKWVEIPS